MIRYLRLFLFPFSLLYGAVVLCRNLLYNFGVLKSIKFDIPVICVGNLVIGGAGKTPMTEYLVNLLAGNKTAILSRGYGRTTKGFKLAGPGVTAADIGDEPMQYYHKFKNVTVAVCEDRAYGIDKLKQQHDLIILDDAFQHRHVNAGLNVLLFDFNSLFHMQWLLPAGNLREPFSGYKRADVLVVTKAPEPLLLGQRAICQSHFNGTKPLFFSFLMYKDPVGVYGSATLQLSRENSVFLLTGIANPTPLIQYLSGVTSMVKHYDFPDHYAFKEADIQKVVHDFNAAPLKGKVVLTTEKDAQRLLDDRLKKLLVNLPVYYLPVSTEIKEEGKTAFDKIILEYVASTKRNG